MTFIPAGEILGETSQVRTLTMRGYADLPDGDYSLVDTHCTDQGCDCRKTMIFVCLDERHVSTINYGWESAEFYRAWYGGPLDADTLAQMQGPSIDMGSPNLVPPTTILAFFTALLDDKYVTHLRNQYQRFRAAIASPAGARLLAAKLGGGGKQERNQPCACGSGRKFKVCCGRGG